MIGAETIATGAAPTCEDCNHTPELDVWLSPAGYYIGTYCDCGPYSRESAYYTTLQEAKDALVLGEFGR